MSDALTELEALLPQIGPAVDRRRFGESLGRTADVLRDASRHVQRLRALLDIARETDFEHEAVKQRGMLTPDRRPKLTPWMDVS
ncbi:hypothetical protein [Methylobacterium sp. 391_Methyba4]|uniref:hypothetical protein n=1 Tax=Methylobacterium sp. 391_Methyba4 TaxID=3038924 RepID=UPI00241C514B|nr:hypothetical protein [Methylobacterium sp. 391_Methyba4]WFS09611.1 hypothetical protein P9K36_10115 [Methylobacterium sp. 391_Methyba4]